MTSRFVSLSALLVAALLAGCPEPPPPTGSGPKLANPQQAGDPPPTPPAGGDAPPAQPAPAEPTTPWEVIPKGTAEVAYPALEGATAWPAPAALQPIESVPQEKRPSPERVRALEELVALVVHPDLRPRDPKAAIGVDAEGRTFMRLGKDRARGTASLDVRRKVDDPKFDRPVFAITLDDAAEGELTLERLTRRVKQVVVPALAEELGKAGCGLQGPPEGKGNFKDGNVAMAQLDRDGFGGQFPYLYAYGSGKHILVLLQEVPHMSLEGR